MMVENLIKTCLRCGGQNLIFSKVNTNIQLVQQEVNQSFGPTIQYNITPTDGVVCKDCGHIEFVYDWSIKG